MPDAAGLFALLLVPVALILFMTRNFGKRLRHPHDLLESSGSPRFARLFFRQLRSRYDLLFDALIALALSLALVDAGGPIAVVKDTSGKSSVVVVDCSRSMFSGEPGFRPIDVALEALSLRSPLEAADRYALVFDPERNASVLLDWKTLARSLAVNDAAARRAAVDNVLSSIGLFSVDYGILKSLPAKGYRDITLLTDSFPMDRRGFKVIETGFAGPRRNAFTTEEMNVDGETGEGGTSRAISIATVDDEAPSIWPSGVRLDRTRGP